MIRVASAGCYADTQVFTAVRGVQFYGPSADGVVLVGLGDAEACWAVAVGIGGGFGRYDGLVLGERIVTCGIGPWGAGRWLPVDRLRSRIERSTHHLRGRRGAHQP